MARVLITAGASGIGRAMAEAFDAQGFEVWITDVDDAAPEPAINCCTVTI